MKMKLTAEQEKIVRAVAEADRIKIFAYAGTGKTTTLRAIAQAYPDKKILYLAFNKAIADEAKRKFPDNTEVRTTHSLAFAHYIRYTKKQGLPFPEIKEISPVDLSQLLRIEETIIDRLKANFIERRTQFNPGRPVKEIEEEFFITLDSKYGKIRKTAFYLARMVKELFNEFCYSDRVKVEKDWIYSRIIANPYLDNLKNLIKSLAVLSTFSLSDTLEKLINQLWQGMEKHEFPVSHNFYLKFFELNLGNLFDLTGYDIVLLDEAQDTNDVTLSIFNKLPGKKVMVGDIHQKIYGFRKSVNAMEKWNADRNLRLTISFRFPSFVADRANDIIVELKGEVAPLVSYSDDIDDEIEDICYISRTNAHLIREMVKLLEEDKTFKLIRPPKEVFRLPLSVLYIKAFWEGNDVKDLVHEKYLFRFGDIDELKEYAKDTEDAELLSAISIVEEFDDELEDIYEQAKRMQRKRKTNIYLTTAHSAKGLEWDRVIICEDFPNLPEIISEHYLNLEELLQAYKNGEEKAISLIEEMNLYYVAITRAKKELIDRSVNADLTDKGREFFDEKIYEARRNENGNHIYC